MARRASARKSGEVRSGNAHFAVRPLSIKRLFELIAHGNFNQVRVRAKHLLIEQVRLHAGSEIWITLHAAEQNHLREIGRRLRECHRIAGGGRAEGTQHPSAALWVEAQQIEHMAFDLAVLPFRGEVVNMQRRVEVQFEEQYSAVELSAARSGMIISSPQIAARTTAVACSAQR